MAKVRFAMALHNHQPIGNFQSVFQAAQEDSYELFLDVMERYPEIPFSLHISGCLLEWQLEHRPEYIDRLRHLVRIGQVELLAGGFYEPILPMIPSRDRQGQISGYRQYLDKLFETKTRGMWVPERVWEPGLVSDIVAAGIEYTVLDDFHFRKAGLASERLFTHYITEDQGSLLKIIPASEAMRYMIPFQDVGNFLGYLGELAQRQPGAVVVFADDGEKFGTWPGTRQHVYENRWLYNFLDALRDNLHWIEVGTLSTVLDAVEPAGLVYLPDCSYREMTEWVLPADRLLEYQRLWQQLDHQENGSAIKEHMKAGSWRNFLAKYPESREMSARMLHVSDKLARYSQVGRGDSQDELLSQARQSLYRGQCNCSYWHGTFGGLYLPHLRNAVYCQLIRAENLLTTLDRGEAARFVSSETGDFNFDGQPDVRLENDQLIAYFNPALGGQMYELDVRAIETNLGASLSRQREAYHETVRHAHEHQGGYEPVVFKQPDLDHRLVYDTHPRKSLIDHFVADDATPATLQACTAQELGDFVSGRYEPSVTQLGQAVQLTLERTGSVADRTIGLSKTISLVPGVDELSVRYRLAPLPVDLSLHFAIELNFAALAAGADDRYFCSARGNKLGPLQSILDITRADRLALVDEWLGIEISLACSQPAGFWAFPIQTVSKSEGGFELVHQSVCLLPHWRIPTIAKTWEVELVLRLDATQAKRRASRAV